MFPRNSHRSSHLVAWAIPLDPVHAIARLEAYFHTKPIICTLAICVRKFSGRSMGKLPAEIILLIADILREDIASVNTRKDMSLIAKWQCRLKCFYEQCSEEDHLNGK